jgi:hypothetical protein
MRALVSTVIGLGFGYWLLVMWQKRKNADAQTIAKDRPLLNPEDVVISNGIQGVDPKLIISPSWDTVDLSLGDQFFAVSQGAY